jgi:hypothetical protein
MNDTSIKQDDWGWGPVRVARVKGEGEEDCKYDWSTSYTCMKIE